MPITINPRSLSEQTIGVSNDASRATQAFFDTIYGKLDKTAAATAQTATATGDATAQTATATGDATAQTATATGGTITKTGDATAQTATATAAATAQTGDATGKNSATATGGTVGAVSESANQTATKQSKGTYGNLPDGEIDLCTSPTVTAGATIKGCQTLDIAAILEAAKKGAQNAAELYDEGKKQGCCPTTIRQPINYEAIGQDRARNRG